MRHVETILTLIAALLIYDVVRFSLHRYLKKRAQRPPTVPIPRTPKDFFEMLQKSGIPFEVMESPPNACPCPVCTAKRDQEKRGVPDGRTLH